MSDTPFSWLAHVSWTAPVNTGGAAIVKYIVTADGITYPATTLTDAVVVLPYQHPAPWTQVQVVAVNANNVASPPALW